MYKKIFLFLLLLLFSACLARPVLAIEPDTTDFGIWHFDEMSGVTAYDASPSQNNLNWGYNIYGFGRPYPDRAPGKWDLGINFSQYEEHYYLEKSEVVDFPHGLSLGLWIKTDYENTDKTKILWLGNYLGSRVQDPSNFIMLSLESGRVVLDLKQDKDWQGSISSSALINDNNWHFVSAVFDVSEHRFYLYLDGQAQGSASFDNPIPTFQRMSIGRREYYYDPMNYNFSGTIDDFWLRKEALPSEKILEIYNSNQPYKQELSQPELAPITVFSHHDFDHINGTVALDNSSNHYDLIWGYNPYNTGEPNPRIVPGKFGNGVNFKKVWDTYAMRLDNAENFNDGMSLGIWIKTDTVSTGQTSPSRILWFGDEMNNRIGDQARGDYFRLTEKDGKLTATISYFDLYSQDSQQVFVRQYNAISDKFISDNEWHQITISIDPRKNNHQLKLYIDGELQSETFFPNQIPPLKKLFLAHRELASTGTEYNYNGDLDDLFVLRSILKPEEVKDIYQVNQPFTWPIQKKRNPVIIVPGIMGSWKTSFGWKLDPILHTYDNLIEALIAAGYREDYGCSEYSCLEPNLFTFPYDWRRDNRETAILLKEKIDEVKAKTGAKKVDIVAHSMGGLVTRAYVESETYQNDVDKVIFLGTPHQGAVDAYMKYEGSIFLEKWSWLTKFVFQIEAIEKGYFSLTDYIKVETPSVEQLLPIYNYLQEKQSDDLWLYRSYALNYPQNKFLENLNLSDNLELLKQRVDILNVYGNLGNGSTLSSIKVVPDDNLNDNEWQNGYPENLDQNSDCLIMGKGDGTVPLTSASAIKNVESAELFNYDHTSLPTGAQSEVVEKLTGNRPSKFFNNKITAAIKRWLFIRVYSPVDFVVTSPSGDRIGKEFSNNNEINEIPDAFYSGFDSDTEFVLIPNPEDGEYKIEVQGVDKGGKYTLAVSYIDNDKEEKESSFIGNILSDEQKDFEINFSKQAEDALGDLEPIDTVPPVIIINNPKENEQFMHSNNLEINYKITDDFSGVASSSVMIDDMGVSTTTINLFDYLLGEHTLKISAQDKAGNQTQNQVKFFVITDINTTVKDIDEIYQRGLLKKISEKAILEIFLKILQTGLTVYEKEAEIINQLIIKTQENSLMSETVKQRLIGQYQKMLVDINNRRTNFINQKVDQIKNKLDVLKKNNQINSLGYDIILSDINYLRINL